MSAAACGLLRQVLCSSASSVRTFATFAASLMRSDLISRMVILSISSPGEMGTWMSVVMDYSMAGIELRASPIPEALADLQLAPQVERLGFGIAGAGGDMGFDCVEDTLAGAAVAIRMDAVGVVADVLHQVRGAAERTFDGREQLLRRV